MADLKDLLGDAYKEDMTFDEVNAVLAEKDLVDKSQFEGFVPKSLLEKANSEAADYKKKWKAASSEQERKAIEEAEQKAQAEEELKSLRRENKVSKYEKQYLAQKYDPKDAFDIAEALYDGDMDTVFKIQQKHDDEVRKSIKAEIMKLRKEEIWSGGHLSFVSRQKLTQNRKGDLKNGRHICNEWKHS